MVLRRDGWTKKQFQGYSKVNAIKTPDITKLKYYPVTRERLPDLVLFSKRHGKFRYCSCMRWRMKATEFKLSPKEHRVAALDGMVLKIFLLEF